ncbi:MAG: phage tail sheath family protein [Deltaproteobacteria bacterium]|nr:MAG: phage tail sheath family protein [Deltaproteobacteria bacterium]
MAKLLISFLYVLLLCGCTEDGKALATPGGYLGHNNPSPSLVEDKMLTTAFIDVYPQSEFNFPIKVTSLSDFEQIFIGNSTSRDEHRLAHLQMKMFFKNGGRAAVVRRVELPLDRELKAEDVLPYLNELKNMEEVATLVLPVLSHMTELEASKVRAEALQYAKEKNVFFIIDPKHSGQLSFEDVILWRDEAQDLISEARSYAAAYFGRLLVHDDELGIQDMYIDPSATMAGVYSRVTEDEGVHVSPANIQLIGVDDVEVYLSSEQMGELNAPINGLSICPFRKIPNVGIVAWGTRTLDGNNSSFRYIQNRRSISMLDRSINSYLERYFLFSPNDANTWFTIKSVISSFLMNLFDRGMFVGASPDEAFNVKVGLGETMTEEDILNGYIKVQIAVALGYPGEYELLNFELKLATGSN